MQKKTLFIIFLCVAVITISSILNLRWFRNKQSVSMPRTPEEALKKILKRDIKEEFLPPDFKVTGFEEIIAKDKLNISPNIASRKIADLYFKDWSYEDAYFTAYVAYNKNSKDFIGYDIGIRVKDAELKGRELGQKYLKDIPSTDWKHRGPVHRSGLWEYDREISSIVFSKGKAKIYLSIVSNEYSEPYLVAWPQKTYIRKDRIIWYIFYMPGNPDYTRVKQIQNIILEGYKER